MSDSLCYRWDSNPSHVEGQLYGCGHCGGTVSPHVSWKAAIVRRTVDGQLHGTGKPASYVHICPACSAPTWWDSIASKFVPAPRAGAQLKYLPPEVETLYNEARDCTGVGASTAAVMLARKLLMNLAVREGARPGLSFVAYVDFLVAGSYVPPKGKPWVDRIRAKGNEANHEIVATTSEDTREIMHLVEMLLRFNFEIHGPNSEPAK
ncbi:DUF4145 domain-containing protein [Methylibium sp.]|uniref:DUF4145 domain-containing protein n=1 Tax=Methylibium sp. TaxID=2067992 RepID=UPI003BAD4339